MHLGYFQAKVYGLAYYIEPSKETEVLEYLDYREKGGYERVYKTFFPIDNCHEPFEILIYIAHLDNKQYAGEADDDTIAMQIVNSIGPSGPNIEYVCRLADAMRQHAPGIVDDHLFTIEEKVKSLSKLRKNSPF